MSRGALLLLLALGLGACDGAFVPTVEGGPAAALFGSLDGRTHRQVLRVQALGSPVIGTPDTLPLTLTSTEVGSGRQAVWRDSLVTLASGERAHLFVAEVAVAPGEVHRIEAVREGDGGRTAVEVRLPDPAATTGPVVGEAVVPVRVTGLPGRVTESRIRYRVRRPDGSGEQTFVSPVTLQIEDVARGFPAFLAPARRRAEFELFGTDGDADVTFLSAQLEAVVFSVGGAPVQNGAGEVGWAVPIAVPIPFTAEALDAAGFLDGR